MTDSVHSSPARSIGEPQSLGSETEETLELVAGSERTIIDGWLKFRDVKKWKQRWGVVTKLSPAADCLHLQLYRDSKDRYKQGQTKASLSLQHFLGVQSGFTLDKESNTIAIICQDVTVVLAFDTRERLIQWQVKIANNLGEDDQYLVQIQSAPSRGKISPGPARLHIQEHQFSLTVGVPPRLVGYWQIGQLRRYGVVENRFCFEGGSRCGRGEGLYVLLCDQGQDIARAFMLAAEGKLHTRRRQHSRTALDSPSVRRRAEPETESAVDPVTWPSCETRPDCDYGDTASVSEQEMSMWTVENNMERCMSCISKLGAMSRSSTMAQTPGSGFSPAWTMETNTSGGLVSGSGSNTSTNGVTPIKDSWPQQDSSATNPADGCHCCHGKPGSHGDSDMDSPQRKRFKPPMPLPSHCGCQQVGPYSNYDVPRPLRGGPGPRDCCSPTDGLYDTPRHMRESLGLSGEFANYDRPPPSRECGCPQRPTSVGRSQVVEWRGGACPCHRVMSWMSLPFYCRRGYGRENTALPPPSDKVKFGGSCNANALSTINTMPIYATIDRSKKTKCRLNQACDANTAEVVESQVCNSELNKEGKENSERLTLNLIKTSEKTDTTNTSHSYMNLEFSKTLGLYENSKDVLTRVEHAENQGKMSTTSESQIVVRNGVKYCSKCGHTCNQNMRPNGKQDDYLMMEPSLKGNTKGNNSISPLRGSMKHFPGYLPMHPVPTSGGFTKTDFLKYNFTDRNGLAGRAASSPSLTAPSVDRSRKPNRDHPSSASSSPYLRRRLRNGFGDSTDEDSRFSLMRRRSNSADSARYIDDLESITERTGSSSPTQVNNHGSSKNTSLDSLCSQSLSIKRLNDVAVSNQSSCSNIPHCTEEVSNTGKDAIEVPYEKLETTKLTDVEGSSFTNDIVESPAPTIQIKRSSSVPCKPGHNRDSSSSNDSGVSLCSLRQRGSDFAEFELPLTTSMSTIRHHHALNQHMNDNACFHASLPRRSKSSDPLRELSFQFQDLKIAPKSSSAEAEVPICLLKKETKGGYLSPSGVPYIDSRSTSSGTSDMSDYIETLSLSSYSSSDTPESLRFSRTAATTLRPRSGKEYHKIDRYFIDGDTKKHPYTIISPVVENSESTSFLEPQQGV